MDVSDRSHLYGCSFVRVGGRQLLGFDSNKTTYLGFFGRCFGESKSMRFCKRFSANLRLRKVAMTCIVSVRKVYIRSP